jgi:hypothetical protein
VSSLSLNESIPLRFVALKWGEECVFVRGHAICVQAANIVLFLITALINSSGEFGKELKASACTPHTTMQDITVEHAFDGPSESHPHKAKASACFSSSTEKFVMVR